MSHKHKRTLNEIASSAPPELRKKLAGYAITESVMSSRFDCLRVLRKAAISTAVCAENERLREESLEILDEIGYRCDVGFIEDVMTLTLPMRDAMARLSMVGHIVVGGRKRLMEATCLVFAAADEDSEESRVSLSLLRSMDRKEATRTLHTLLNLGLLSPAEREAILSMDLWACGQENEQRNPASGEEQTPAPRVSDPPPVQEPPPEMLPSGIDASGGQGEPCMPTPIPESDSAVRWPDEAPETEPCIDPSLRRSTLKKKRKKKTTSILPWDSRKPLPDITDAAALRNETLRNRSTNLDMMCRVICVFGFRITGQKALIGEKYANVSSVRQNVIRLVKGDKEFISFFKDCWDKMAIAKAIQFKKRGDVASLPPRTGGISDEQMAQIVEWALSENRRLTC